MRDLKNELHETALKYMEMFGNPKISSAEISASGFRDSIKRYAEGNIDLGMVYNDFTRPDRAQKVMYNHRYDIGFCCGFIVSSWINVSGSDIAEKTEVRTLFADMLETLADITSDDAYTLFWHCDGENGYLSNWYRCDFTVDGVTYHFIEQYMMAQKARLFGDDEAFRAILRSDDPKTCKMLGRRVRGFDSETWDREKYNIVKTGVRAKFEQNPELLLKLYETGDSVIAECSPYDNIWGTGIEAKYADRMLSDEWYGENLLGKILMDVRKEIINLDISELREFDKVLLKNGRKGIVCDYVKGEEHCEVEFKTGWIEEYGIPKTACVTVRLDEIDKIVR